MLNRRTAWLIYNPAARRGNLFESQLPGIVAQLRSLGIIVTAFPTSVLSSLVHLPTKTDMIFACGGDGTVHQVIQLMTKVNPTQPLGVVPLGTANALARNLRLPLDPWAAIERLLTYTPVQIPLGQIVTETETRSFIVMAGCGPDGALIHSLPASEKARLGRTAYYTHAARLFFMRRWPAFEVAWSADDGTPNRATAIGMIASRVPDLGGAFSGLTPRARLTSNKLHVLLLSPPAQLSLPAWFGLARLGLPNPWLRTIEVDEVHCSPITADPIYAQADAEPMGALPFTLRIVPDALTLLMPR